MNSADSKTETATPGADGRRTGVWRSLLAPRRKDNFLGIALIMPAALVFAIVILGPMLWGVFLAFHRVQEITLNTRFIGFRNFQTILETSTFLNALITNFKFAFGSLVIETVLGVLVALLLNQQFYGRAAARSLAIFPYLLPVVVAAAVWRWMFNDTYGIVNQILIDFGLLEHRIAWISDPDYALAGVIVVNAWRCFPFIVIASLGRLQNIPRQLYEAARIDGAGQWSMFWDITLPQLRSVLVVSIFLRFIWDFNDFNTIALMTGGGPAGRTQTIPIMIYQLAFGQMQLGVAAAVADLGLAALAIFFVIYFWLAKPLGKNS
ncbi:carbohydrate ABC transporter permease [Shinella sp.]|uniref:carbohydrate ABC transporter permease n=1 Tax=Shinella sp. TaxID=1870904 RepID=UPI003F726B3C